MYCFLCNSKNWSKEIQDKENKAKLIGSWKVEVGDQDQYGNVFSSCTANRVEPGTFCL